MWNHLQSKHVKCISEDKIKFMQGVLVPNMHYLQVLVPGQRHGSGLLVGHLLPKDEAGVADNGLDRGS
jgi:hypothetical protein